jgi:hypothetical protein
MAEKGFTGNGVTTGLSVGAGVGELLVGERVDLELLTALANLRSVLPALAVQANVKRDALRYFKFMVPKRFGIVRDLNELRSEIMMNVIRGKQHVDSTIDWLRVGSSARSLALRRNKKLHKKNEEREPKSIRRT